jgi:hypothetical protein
VLIKGEFNYMSRPSIKVKKGFFGKKIATKDLVSWLWEMEAHYVERHQKERAAAVNEILREIVPKIRRKKDGRSRK